MNTSRNSAKKLNPNPFSITLPQPLIYHLGFWLAAAAVGVLLATQSAAYAPALMVGGIICVIALLYLIHPLTAVIGMLILAPMRVLIETEAALRLPLDIGQITFLLLALVWLIHRAVQQKRLIQVTWFSLYLPLGVFVAVSGLTLFNAFSVGAWLSEWLKWVIILGLVAFVGMLQRWEWLIFGLVCAGVANALVGLYIFFGGSGALHLLVEGRYFRAFGTFGQPNPFGGFMGLLAPLAAASALAYLSDTWRDLRAGRRRFTSTAALLFYSSSFALLSLGVIISWSRGAWLAFAASMLIVVFSLPRKFWQSLLLLVSIFVIGTGLWTSGRLPVSIVERINSATQELFAFDDVRAVDITPENYAVVERLAHWQAALNIARSNPWLGVGIGNYEIAYDQYRLMNWDEPLGHAHNYYLNVLAETGMIGAITYAALWGTIFLTTWRVRQHPDRHARLIAIGLLGTWTYLSVHSLTDNLYVNNIFLHIGIMIGIIGLLDYQLCQGLTRKIR